AGIDLKELSFGEGAGAPPYERRQGPFPQLTKPLIGAVNGVAVTGGFEYALGCDFLIASERARFADTHGRVGVMPGWGLTVHLAEAIGVRRARQLSFTGDYLDPHTAMAWGLVNEVVAHDDLMGRTLEIGRTMGELVPGAAANLKETYRQVLDLAPGVAWAVEEERSQAWMQSGYDRSRLAASREGIQQRGRGQI
ncbi:MAG: enoyl-CoA hydratase-related protein, partial [Acidimicrobiales bacterium]